MVEYYRHESKLYLLFYYIARINKPKPESLVVLKILNNMKEGEGRPASAGMLLLHCHCIAAAPVQSIE
jgi:hypothetical protein